MPTYPVARLRNWSEMQHYKNRDPVWLKLYLRMMQSEDWISWNDASKLLAIVCIMLAGRSKEGFVTLDPLYVKRVAFLDQDVDFGPLISSGFLILDDDASNTLAARYQHASQMLDRGEEREERRDYGASAPLARIPDPDNHPVTGKKPRVRSKRQPVQYTSEFEMWWSEFKKGHPRDGGTKSDAFTAWQTTDHPPVGDMIRIWTRQKEGVFKEGFGVKDGQGYLNRGQWQTGDVLSPEFGKMTDAQKDAIGLPRHWNSREAALLEQRAKEVEGGRGEERVFPDDDDIPFA